MSVASADDEDMDPTVYISISFILCNAAYLCYLSQQYFENRLKYLAAEKAKGENPYPHKFAVSMSIPEYIEKYGGLNNGDHVEDAEVSLAGMFKLLNAILFLRVERDVHLIFAREDNEQASFLFQALLL